MSTLVDPKSTAWVQSVALTSTLYYSEEHVGKLFGASAIRRARRSGEIKFIRAAGCYAYKGQWVSEWLERVAVWNASQANMNNGRDPYDPRCAAIVVGSQLINSQVAETCNGQT